MTLRQQEQSGTSVMCEQNRVTPLGDLGGFRCAGHSQAIAGGFTRGAGSRANQGLLHVFALGTDKGASETDGVWGPASVPELPANAMQAPPVVGAIACSISNGCIVAGTYDAEADASVASASAVGSAAAASGPEPYLVRRTATGWSRATQLMPPAPTRAQILAAIRVLLSGDRHGAAAARGHKRYAGGLRPFAALEAGKVAVRWTSRVGRRSVLVARAAAKITNPATIKLHIRVTKAGATLLRTSRTIKVADRVVFTPVGLAVIRASDSFRLAGSRQRR
jgi:hypothetical protein